MAWVNTEIAVSDETVKGSINASGDVMRIEIPFVKGVSVGDSVTANGSEHKITKITNTGGRDETLTLEVANDKPVSRRTSAKAGK